MVRVIGAHQVPTTGVYLATMETFSGRMIISDPTRVEGELKIDAESDIWYCHVHYDSSTYRRMLSEMRLTARTHVGGPRKFRNVKVSTSGILVVCDERRYVDLTKDRYEDVVTAAGLPRRAGGVNASLALTPGYGGHGEYDCVLHINPNGKVIGVEMTFTTSEEECALCGSYRYPKDMVGGLCQECLKDED